MSKVFKSIGKAIGGVFKAIGGIVKAVVDIVSSVINFVIQPFMGLFGGGMPDAGQEAQRQQGVLVQRQGSNVNIPVIYGMRQVGGTVTYAETGSSNNQYLWVAYVLGEGPVEGLWDLYIDDYQVPDKYVKQAMAGLGNVVAIGDGKYKDRVQFQFFPGTFYEEADIGNSVVPERTLMKDSPLWKDTMYYNGLAVLFVRYYWKKIESQADADANPFTGSIPQIKATLLGRKVQTLITGSDWSTYGTNERYSTNPAEIVADYLRNPRYGKGLSNDEMDWDSFQIAAQKCNQEVEYVTDTFGPILTTNYVLDTNNTLLANTKILLSGSRLYMPYVQGKYKLKVEDAGDPTDILSGSATIAATFTPDNIQGNVTFTGIEKSSKYTSVKVTWVDPDNKWSTQTVVWPETEEERQTYIDADGGRENVQEATFGNITNYAMAKDMARLLFNKSRYQETCSLTVSSQALELEPGDVIRIQSNILDFDTDPWRIVSFKINDNMTVELGCVRTQESIYPHTRLNEEDTVLPPFIPKGAGIYYPTSQNDRSIGLIPPTHVPGYNETNPNTSAGGGVGNPNGAINGGTEPTPVEIIQLELTDSADFYDIRFETTGGNILKGQFKFYQPQHAMYDGIDFYYKLETENGFRQIKVDTKKGPGLIIDFFIDNLIVGQRYQAASRVRYSTGEYSQIVTKFLFVPNGYPNFRFTPDDNIELVGTGWGLPEYQEIEITNNVPRRVQVNTLSPASGSNARRLTVSVTEDLARQAPNSYIDGMTVFWRPTNSLFWKQQVFAFQQEYISGNVGTFIIDSGLGDTGDTPVTYDFIFRYHYNFNGKEKQSTLQRRYMGADITNDRGGFGIFATTTVTAIDPAEGVGDYTFQIGDEDTVSDPRDYTMLADYIVTLSGSGTNSVLAVFGVEDNPTALNNQYYEGFRVYYRRYDPFQYPNNWQFEETTQAFDGSGKANISIPCSTGYEYEFAVVPLVDDSGSIVEAYNCFYYRGYPVYESANILPSNNPKIPNVTTTNYDGSTQLNFEQLWGGSVRDFSEVNESKQRKQIVGDLVPDISQFIMRNFARTGRPWRGGAGANYLSNAYVLSWDWSQVGASYAGLRIYRRKRVKDLLNLNDPKFGDYYGLGYWEYRDISGTYSGSNDNATTLIRPPIDYTYYFTDGTTQNAYWSNIGGEPITVCTRYDEFIFVILEDDGGGVTESPRGVFMKGADWGTDSQINCYNPKVVTLADYNTGVPSDRYLSNAVQSDANLSGLIAKGDNVWGPYGNSPAVENLLGITDSGVWLTAYSQYPR